MTDIQTAGAQDSSADPLATQARSAFPIPFTWEQVREEVVTIYLHELRNMRLFVSDAKLFALAGKADMVERELWDSTYGPADYHLRADDLADSALMFDLKRLYDFAFLGHYYPHDDEGEDEPLPNEADRLVSAYITDVSRSQFSAEFESRDLETKRCSLICDLASARNVLEGFSSAFGETGEKPGQVENWELERQTLSVHEMALLAAMEDMSIRTAISRSGPNQLPTIKVGHRTRIRPEDAKAWLKAKNLYVPILRPADIGREIRLESTRFGSFAEFADAVRHRIRYAAAGDLDGFASQLHALSARYGFDQFMIPGFKDALMHDYMVDLGVLLQWPGEVFALRAREAVLQQQVKDNERALQDLLIRSAPF